MRYNTFYYNGNERWEKKKQATMSKSIVNNNITWHNKTLQNELDTFYIKGQNWWYRTSFHISYIFIFIPLTTTTTQDKNAMKILKIKPTLLLFVCRNLTYVHQIDIYFLLQNLNYLWNCFSQEQCNETFISLLGFFFSWMRLLCFR